MNGIINSRYLYLLNWASPLVYTISLIFYLIDLGLDIVVGISMIDDFGGVILGVVFLPVLPMIGLYVMRNMYKVKCYFLTPSPALPPTVLPPTRF